MKELVFYLVGSNRKGNFISSSADHRKTLWAVYETTDEITGDVIDTEYEVELINIDDDFENKYKGIEVRFE